jgi:hypothetical protein
MSMRDSGDVLTPRPVGPYLPSAASPTADVGLGRVLGAANAVCGLNDEFRRDFSRGRVVLTAGVAALTAGACAKLLRAVRTFDAFDAGNDPHDEHDFGKVEISGEAYFWKIDCYDTDLLYGSPNPADPAVTRRVMTIMRSEEY